MEKIPKDVLEEALLNAHVKTEGSRSDFDDTVILDQLIDKHIQLIDLQRLDYLEDPCKQKFIILKGTLMRLGEYMMIRERRFTHVL